ncbi:outer membrane protein, OMP85 family [Hypoxylon sp. NC1633]|nr:outer membrane protein, OMP85 family [Hypoxylon sp. NC1633]
MARNASPGDDDVVQGLPKSDTASMEKDMAPERHKQHMKDLLSQNRTLPVTISSIEIHGAKHTRKSFLTGIFQPLVEETGKTLGDMLDEVSGAIEKLNKFDIFHSKIQVHLSNRSQLDPAPLPIDADLSLRVREKSRLFLKTGTEVDNAEASAYGSLLYRNVFGGAEFLSLNASTGSRTRSSYSAEFSTPLQSNPNLRLSIEGLASSTQKPRASHEEVLRGGGIKLNWLRDNGDRHQFAYSNIWSQLTGLAATASPTVRADAGDSAKSAISYIFQRERRDNPMLPQSGYFIKTATELAGWGSLGGDVGFLKSEFEVSRAVPVPISWSRGLPGVSIGAGFRSGLLYPLPLSYGIGGASPSRIGNRFTLGGSTDVRGFSLNGLGPRDGGDAIGGDVFAAGSVNVLIPLPRVGPESPFRLQLFANGGRLVAMKKTKGGNTVAGQPLGADAVWDGMISATKELGTGLPSLAAGVGLVYALSAARFEVNFSLPLVVRQGEEARKGLSVGVGINFL